MVPETSSFSTRIELFILWAAAMSGVTLEMIFPPLFFDLMEHLPIYLPFEIKIGGPVQCRWMYPFKRSEITHAS
jgi:hypothetical protein